MSAYPPETADEAINVVQTILDADSGSVEACLRFQPGRIAILSGKLNSEPAVFRLALSDDVKATLESTWTELQRIEQFMSTGRYQAARGLAHFDADGLLVISKANGESLLPMMSNSEPTQHVRDLAEWLWAYASPTLQNRPAHTMHWLKRAEKSCSKQPHPTLKTREQQILEVLRHLSADLETDKWRVAISHGDYHPNNLIWDGQVLTGIDIGGSAFLPIYKDMARSLVHLARRNIFEHEAMRFGVNDALIRAYSGRFQLSEVEMTRALPFFIGFECLIKVELPKAPAWRISAAEKLYDGFLAEFGQT